MIAYQREFKKLANRPGTVAKIQCLNKSFQAQIPKIFTVEELFSTLRFTKNCPVHVLLVDLNL